MNGDVVISLDTAALAARQRRRPLAAVLDELLVHGVLHLLGYDHEISPAEERRMARRAREVRAAIGPLAAPASTSAVTSRATSSSAARGQGATRRARPSAARARKADVTGQRSARTRRG